MNRRGHLEKLQSNIVKNYLFLGLNYVDLTRGLWMIWLTIQGFSLTQLGILEGTFHLTSFLMEVPTGIVADLFGRKTSRILGRILFLGSLFILYFSRSMPIQCIAFALTALGYNLVRGAGVALIYYSLKELGREVGYKKIAGINNVIFEAGSVVSLIVGGYCAHYLGYLWVFIPGMSVCVLSIFVSTLFEEPTLTQNEQHRLRQMGWLKAMSEQTRESLLVIKENPRIAFIILFTELVMMFITSLYFYLQTFWKANGYNELQIGGFLAIAAVLSAVAGVLAHRIERRLGVRGIILVFPLLLILSLWGLGLTDYSVIFFTMTGFVDGVLYVAMQDYLNKMIPSERRATILSFQSMAFSMYMIIFFPIIGLIGETRGLQKAFLLLAVIATLLYGLYILIAGRKRKN
jgi:MFS family permease